MFFSGILLTKKVRIYILYREKYIKGELKMINIYYRSVFTIFIIIYILLYIASIGFHGKLLYVNEFIRIVLGKSNKKNRISLITIIGHIFNIIILIIGVIGNKLIDGKTAFIIYKWSIPVFLILLIIIEEFVRRNE
jgi:hypothetical protein